MAEPFRLDGRVALVTGASRMYLGLDATGVPMRATELALKRFLESRE